MSNSKELHLLRTIQNTWVRANSFACLVPKPSEEFLKLTLLYLRFLKHRFLTCSTGIISNADAQQKPSSTYPGFTGLFIQWHSNGETLMYSLTRENELSIHKVPYASYQQVWKLSSSASLHCLYTVTRGASLWNPATHSVEFLILKRFYGTNTQDSGPSSRI